MIGRQRQRFLFLLYSLLTSWKPILRILFGKTSPEEGLSKPANKPSKVDLPEPEGPVMAKDSPSSTFKLISSKNNQVRIS